MSDCVNVEMRELLPELASGRLDAETRARVEAHVVACADCAAELDTLRSVRAAFGHTPDIDVERITRALPRPSVATPVRRWTEWRIAATIAVVTLGALTAVVTHRVDRGGEGTRPTGMPPIAAETIVASANAAPNAIGGVPGAARLSSPSITFAGGVSDLDAADMRELLGALDEIDAAPVAPAVEPDRAAVVPALREEGV